MAGILDELKAGLESLLDRVAGDDLEPLPSRTPDEIRQMVEQRAQGRGALSNLHAIAKRASAAPQARKARQRMARQREARAHKRSAERAAQQQRAQQAAFEDFKRQAAAEPNRASSSSGARAGGSRRRRGPGAAKHRSLAKHYDTLGLPHGVPFPEVKKAFRRLMRKYHPDMHGNNPRKQKAASELTKDLTVAYNAIDEHLNKR